MEKRKLGRTGHLSSVAILGGAAFARATPEQTARSFETAMFKGINHLDVAPSYGDAEVNLGPLIPDQREHLFVGCKTHRRDPDGVKAQMAESLERLQIDRFDLYQIHGVTDLEDLDSRSAAFEVIHAAREEGVARFIGVTGHDLGTPRAQLEAVKRWDLDTVMFPLSPRLWNEPEYREDAQALLSHCRTFDIGVQIIKAVSWRPWRAEPTLDTWYEPRTDDATIKRNVDFVLSTPGVTCLATPGDRSLLDAVIAAANRPGFVSSSKRKTILAEAASEPLIFPMAEHARSRD